MKVTHIVKFLVAVSILTATALTAQTFSGGSGIESDPYLISSKADLDELADIVNYGEPDWSWNKYFKVINDITEPFQNRIGIYTPDAVDNGSVHPTFSHLFAGSFDGNGHRIVLDINLPEEDGVGLFGSVCGGPVNIKNVILEGSVIGRFLVGGLIGEISGATDNPNSNIICCYSHCAVTSIGRTYNQDTALQSMVGGLIGYGNCSMLNCYTTGNIIAKGNYAGGLIGYHRNYIILNCYATGNVICESGGVGGIAGSSSGRIFNCYFTGNISSNDADNVGGIIGRPPYKAEFISNCYYLDTWLADGLPSNEYGTSITAEEMKTLEFVELLNAELQLPTWLDPLFKQKIGAWEYDLDNVNQGFPITTCAGDLYIADAQIQHIIVFPNPTNATSTLTFDIASSGNLTITLTDLLGAELFELHNAFTDAGVFVKTFSIEALPVGIYYLKINHSGNIRMEKVVKE